MGLLRMADPSDAAVDEDVRGADDASPPLFSRHAGPVEGPAPAAVGVPEDVVAVAHRSAVRDGRAVTPDQQESRCSLSGCSSFGDIFESYYGRGKIPRGEIGSSLGRGHFFPLLLSFRRKENWVNFSFC